MSAAPAHNGTPLGRSLRRAFGAFLVVLLVVGSTGLFVLDSTYGYYTQATEHAYPLQQANEQALIAMINAETAVRGYALSGAPEYVDDWQESRSIFPMRIQRLRDLSASDPGLQSRLLPLLDEEERRAEEWLVFANARVQDRAGLNLLGNTPERALETSLRGKRLFDSFRNANAEVEAVLVDHRVNLDGGARRGYLMALTIIPIVMVGGFIVAIGLGVTVSRRTTQPLNHVDRVLKRMRSGEPGVRADVNGPAEVRAVAEAVNDLAVAGEEVTRLRTEGAARDAVIKRISERVREHIDLDVVLDRSVNELAGVFSPSRVRLTFLTEENGATSESRAEWNAEGLEPLGPGRVTPALAAAIKRVAEEGVVVAVDSTSTHDFADGDGVRDALMAMGAAALITAPVTVDGRSAGIITIMQDRPREWSAYERSVLHAAASEIGSALGHARLYQDQKALVQKLEEVDRTRSDFVSSISHELRTPLASIMGYSEMLLENAGGQLNDRSLSMVEVIDRNSHRLLALIEDLLTLSRIEAGAFKVSVAPTDVEPLIRSVTAALEPTMRKRDMRIEVDIDTDDTTAVVDAGQIERVLMNLLSNAMKFSAEGGTVRVSATRRDGRFVVAVADTGMGIPLEEQGRLFSRFFRSSLARAEEIQGTGLGLVIVKSIIDNHGGAVRVDSAPGQGTTVTFELPVTAADKRPPVLAR